MDDDTIPARLRPEDTPPLRTQADLHRHWRALMGELGFSGRRLWVLFLDLDDRPTPLLLQIDDLPEYCDEPMVEGLISVCRATREEHNLGRVAVLLSRPGGAEVRGSDRWWGRCLLSAADRGGVPFAPVHLANDEDLHPLTGDDLLAAG